MARSRNHQRSRYCCDYCTSSRARAVAASKLAAAEARQEAERHDQMSHTGRLVEALLLEAGLFPQD